MKNLKIPLLLLCVLGVLLYSNQAYAYYVQVSPTEFRFYPAAMTYVDRENPTTNVGSIYFNQLKVGDSAVDYPEGEYYEAINAERTFLKFSTNDLKFALSILSIDSASLWLYFNSGSGSEDTIYVHSVDSADSNVYISGLTWDGQKGNNVVIGSVYANRDINSSEAVGWKQWTGNLYQLAKGWRGDSIANYGIALENDYDGRWSKISATQYTISDPSQMNELEATFRRDIEGQVDYRPFLKVTGSVIPEPTTLSLLGLGLLGFAFKRKKKIA